MCLSATRGRPAPPRATSFAPPAARLARSLPRSPLPSPTHAYMQFNPMHRLLPRIAAPRPSSRLRPSCSHAPARPRRAQPISRAARALRRAAARRAPQPCASARRAPIHAGRRRALAVLFAARPARRTAHLTRARSLSLRRCAVDVAAHQRARRVTPRRMRCVFLLSRVRGARVPVCGTAFIAPPRSFLFLRACAPAPSWSGCCCRHRPASLRR